MDLSSEEREANRAEWAAWRETPEGKAEIVAHEAAKAESERVETERYAALVPIYIDHVLREAGVPERALAVVPHDTPAMQAVAGALDLLVLLGAPGVGKSVAAAKWLRDYVSDPSRWTPSNWDLLTTPRGSMYPAHSSRLVPSYKETTLPIWISAAQLARTDHYNQTEIDRIAKAPRLVIDDLFSEFSDSKGFFQALLDEIIDLRYSGKRPTVITTNFDVEAFKARYGERVVDRLVEGGRFYACGNTSLRRRPAP
jgi:hypothetical protein